MRISTNPRRCHFIQRLPAAHPAYLSPNPLGTSFHIGRRAFWVHCLGIGQYGRQSRGLPQSNLAGRLFKISLAGGLDTKNAIAKLGNVHIHFQDSLFAPEHLDQRCKIGLDPFTEKRFSRSQKKIFGHLLGNGGCPAETAAVDPGLNGIYNGFKIKSMVRGKFLVFRGNDCQWQMSGDLFPIFPAVIDLKIFLVIHRRFESLVDHHHADRRVEPAQAQNKQKADDYKPQ